MSNRRHEKIIKSKELFRESEYNVAGPMTKRNRSTNTRNNGTAPENPSKSIRMDEERKNREKDTVEDVTSKNQFSLILLYNLLMF